MPAFFYRPAICLRDIAINSFGKQQGIILVTVLLFLFIFALLAIAGLSGSQLQIRMGANLAQQNQNLQAAEAGLLKGEHLLQASVTNACIITDAPVAVQQRPWLAGESCILNYDAHAVHYIVQLQYANACLLTGIGHNKQGILNQGNIYRITAWLQQREHPLIILQTTYAKAETASCVNPPAIITPGRLSWREIE